MSDLRDKIFNSNGSATRDRVSVPEFGDATVEVRGMTVRMRADMFGDVRSEDDVDLKDMYPKLLIATCYDPDTGEQLFSHDDVEAILDLDAQAVDRLAKVAMRMAGVGEEVLDETAKNSATTLSDVSSSS